MRHRKAGRQFGRNTSHRRAMFRALAANLLVHERIETTDAKAKELRRVAERLITRAIRLGPIAYTPHAKLSGAERARRLAAQQRVGRFLRRFATVPEGDGYREVDLIEKVFVELAQRYRERRGGYTRIIKVGRRRGDNAPMSIIELVDSEKAAAAAAPLPEPEPEPEPEAPAAEAKTEAKAEPAEAKAEPAAEPEAEAAEPEKKPAKKAAKAKADEDDDESEPEEKPAKKKAAKAKAKQADEDEDEPKKKAKAAKKPAKAAKKATKAADEKPAKKKASKSKAKKKTS